MNNENNNKTGLDVFDMPNSSNDAPMIDGVNVVSAAENDALVVPSSDITTTAETVADSSMVSPSVTPEVSSFNQLDNAIENNLDYNFDFASQVNTPQEHSVPIVSEPVAPVEPVEPIVDDAVSDSNVEAVSPVPIIMPEDNYNKSINNEAIAQESSNQSNNTLGGYINDDSAVSNTLHTASIVKESEDKKEDKKNLTLLIVLVVIFAIFILFLPTIFGFIG